MGERNICNIYKMVRILYKKKDRVLVFFSEQESVTNFHSFRVRNAIFLRSVLGSFCNMGIHLIILYMGIFVSA